MSERKIWALTGYAGTGKTTCAEYLANAHGLVAVEGSALIREAATNMGVILEARRDYELVFRAMQRSKGMAWIAEATLASTEGDVLQSGLRAIPDFHRIKQAGGSVIALTCAREVCLSRIDTANPKNPRTVADYFNHQDLESSPDIDGYGSSTGWCVDSADYVINTTQSLAATFAELDVILAGQ
jgi:dephospho-CoA kinase